MNGSIIMEQKRKLFERYITLEQKHKLFER